MYISLTPSFDRIGVISAGHRISFTYSCNRYAALSHTFFKDLSTVAFMLRLKRSDKVEKVLLIYSWFWNNEEMWLYSFALLVLFS